MPTGSWEYQPVKQRAQHCADRFLSPSGSRPVPTSTNPQALTGIFYSTDIHRHLQGIHRQSTRTDKPLIASHSDRAATRRKQQVTISPPPLWLATLPSLVTVRPSVWLHRHQAFLSLYLTLGLISPW